MNPQKQHTLPEGWEMKKLGEVGKISSGTTPSRSLQEKYFNNGRIPWVKTTDLNNSNILETEENITDAALKETSLRIYPIGTILVAMYGGFNQIGRTGLLGVPATINQALSAISLWPEMHSEFVLNWLNSNVEEWKRFAGSSRKDPNINSRDVADFPIACPPLPEQRRIAAVLGTWDTAIEQITELLKALRARHRGLMHQLLTGKVRLPGFGGEWKKVKANEIFKNVSIRNRPNEPLLSVTQERGVIPRSMLEGRVTMPESETSSYKLVVPGDFIISLRSFQGGIETSDYQGVVSPAYTVLKPKIDIEDNFYRHYFKSIRFIRQLGVAVIGIRDGKQISFDDFSAIVIPKPSLAEQRAIAQVLDASLKEIQQQEAKLEALREQKRGLMQCLLTGRVRVPAA